MPSLFTVFGSGCLQHSARALRYARVHIPAQADTQKYTDTHVHAQTCPHTYIHTLSKVCQIKYLSILTYLDLVPPVPFWESGDELSQYGTLYRNWFGVNRVEFHFFFKCLAPGLNGSYCHSNATFKHPLHRDMCHPNSR